MSVKTTQLSNGLRVATDSMADAESVVVGVWVGVGTRHEPWNANGVAHLVEHMMFKGTQKRSAYALSAAIEKNGGMMNAYTTREETAYYARVLPEDTALATDIIADMIQNSVFKPKELAREKQVIIQEIGRDLDSPEDHIWDVMYSAAFPKQKLGRSILGSSEVIANLPRDAAVDYINRHYHAANMVVVAAGRVDHGDFVDLVQKAFGSLLKGKVAPHEKARFGGGPQTLAKEIEQMHVMIAYPGAGRHQRDVYASQLLGILLGGNSSSRLFQKVREQRGLVYTVSAGHSPLSDTGLFQIYAGTDPARLDELIPVIGAELKDVTHNIKASELARAKAQCRADILMGKESVMRRAEVLGHQMIAFGKSIPAERTLEKLMAVSAEDVQAVATKLFARKPVVSLLGPGANDSTFDKVLQSVA